MAAAACVISFFYCAVFFLKKKEHRAAALFAVDALVLAALFIGAAPPAAILAFTISAACVNITIFFAPFDAAPPVYTWKDLAAAGVNVLTAVFSALYILKNRQEAGFQAGPLNPVITVFLFMALSAAGYFTASAGTGEKK